jgi:hypothetical protein
MGVVLYCFWSAFALEKVLSQLQSQLSKPAVALMTAEGLWVRLSAISNGLEKRSFD